LSIVDVPFSEEIMIVAGYIITAAVLALPPAVVVWNIRRFMLRGRKREGKGFPLALHRAAQQGHVKVLQQLLTKGYDVNQRDAYGWTPLHAAILGGQPEAAEFLLFNSADANLRSADGHTPLHYAAKQRDEKLAQLLVQYGADPDRL
jgi:ankyrin repeat protein